MDVVWGGLTLAGLLVGGGCLLSVMDEAQPGDPAAAGNAEAFGDATLPAAPLNTAQNIIVRSNFVMLKDFQFSGTGVTAEERQKLRAILDETKQALE